MTAEQSLVARLALSVAASTAGVLLATSPRIHLPSRPVFRRIMFTIFPLSRLMLYLLVFFVLKIPPRGDVVAYYFPQGMSILAGLLPYRDFPSSYGPLHSYIDAAVLRAWLSPLALILFAIVVESFLLPLWLGVSDLLFEEREVRIASVLYLTSPLSLQFVTLDGTNGIMIGVLAVLALVLLKKKHPFFSGVTVAFSIVAVKFLSLIYVPAFFLASSRRMRWLLGFVITIACGYAFFVFKRAPVLHPLLFEGSLRTPGDLPYLIETLLGFELPARVWDLLVFAVLSGILILSASRTRQSSEAGTLRILTATLPALTFALLLFSKKSFPAYLIFVVFPICLLFSKATRMTLVWFAVATTSAIMAPSVWFTLMENVDATALHRAVVSGQRSALLFSMLQIAVVAGYAWVLSMSLLWITRLNALSEVTKLDVDERAQSRYVGLG